MLQPLRRLGPLRRHRILNPSLTAVAIRRNTVLSATATADDTAHNDTDAAPVRKKGSFFVSNVMPIRLGRFDFRPLIAQVREEYLLEELEDIAAEVDQNGWKLEGLEISKKDGGVFLNYSYDHPSSEADAKTFSPARTFLPLLSAASHRHGGFPSWLGQWYANTFLPGVPQISVSAVEEIERTDVTELPDTIESNASASQVFPNRTADKEAETRPERRKRLFGLGDGRCWAVRGKQWTEDMDRYPSARLRVEFDGPDVSQEVLYELFRPYGRVSNIIPPSPVPAGSLRYATILYTHISPSTVAINTLHGLSTPTNTKDFTLVKDSKAAPEGTPSTIPRTRLRLFYERPLKAHAFRDWVTGHPRISIPIAAFLIGTLSYTFFDPIRAFFVKAHVEGYFDVEGYSAIKWIRSKFVLPSGFTFGGKKDLAEGDGHAGEKVWEDRMVAEKQIMSWLGEVPGTFITITGPSGSGKAALVNRTVKDTGKKSLYIDCSKIAKAKSDAAVMNELAAQTGYWPVFTFLNNISGLIDLAAVGLIGQKAGFATPLDQQIKAVLEVVAVSLKDVSDARRQANADDIKKAERDEENRIQAAERSERIRRGGWHDGRLDCVAGNGIMSELGFGDEELLDSDMYPPTQKTAVDTTGLALPSGAVLDSVVEKPVTLVNKARDLDAEREYIDSLPILVLDNFVTKGNNKTETWNVLADWAAGLVEAKIAHVVVVCDSSSVTKALTRALPAKPLNSVSLADADRENSMAYVLGKLGSAGASLQDGDRAEVEKIGGRMADLELLVYKVRTGYSVKEAVTDIVSRSVVELRKAAFGDDGDDAKTLPWSRAQAWAIVKALAQKKEIPYASLLQDYPFKSNEAALRALEDHDLIAVSYHDGRPSMVRPGKPLYTQVFKRLANDSVFAAQVQIEYNNSLISSSETTIKSIEDELLRLKEIATHTQATESAWSNLLSLSGKSATDERVKYLLGKMGEAVKKLGKLEGENVELKGVLATGR